MSWDEREKQELELDEGRRLKAYKDSEGYWTIGIGHLLGNNPEYADSIITDEQCDELFVEDFETAVKEAQEAFDGFAGLDGPRKGALVNLAFELGTKLSTFHGFLNLLDTDSYEDAADDLLKTRYAKQVPARAGRIAYRIRTGQYANR
jgi:lysozyme